MKKTIIPVSTTYGYIEKGALHFNSIDGELVISTDVRELQDILRVCDGIRSIDEIERHLGIYPSHRVRRLINFLLKKKILIDSTRQYSWFHQLSSNPSIYSVLRSSAEIRRHMKLPRLKRRHGTSFPLLENDRTAVSKIASDRVSSRLFEDGPISKSDLVTFLSSLYGNDNWYVPSAGASYSLDIFVTLFCSIDDLPKGTFQYLPESKELIRFSKKVHRDSFHYALNDCELLNGSNLLVSISANLERVSYKYSNRAYRYVLLEAGHLAQNGYLTATELGLAILEYGGFNDTFLCKLLDLNPATNPVLTTLLLGKKSRNLNVQPRVADLSETLEIELIDRSEIVDGLAIEGYRQAHEIVPRYFAFAAYGMTGKTEKSEITQRYSCGSGFSVAEASMKAMAEAYERHVSHCLMVDLVAKPAQLKTPYLSPEALGTIRYGEFGNSGLQALHPDVPIQWKEAYKLSSAEKLFVPAEMVYYPISKKQLERVPCWSGNSSGVATHTDKDKAILCCLMELVERDAFMVSWYSEKALSKIPLDQIPDDVNGRLSIHSKAELNVTFVNLTLDSIPVVLCVFYQPYHPYHLGFGLAASFRLDDCITKSFNEAEFNFLSWKTRRWKSIRPEKVRTVRDHGKLYLDLANHNEIRRFIDVAEIRPSRYDYSAKELIKFLDPVVIEMARPNTRNPLWVIRTMSSRLIQMNFGFGTEVVKKSRMSELGLEWSREFPAMPHFFI